MNDEGTLTAEIKEWEVGEGVCIAREGGIYGPYSVEEIRQYLASGEILPDDFAWRDGSLLEWARLRDLLIEMGVTPEPPPAPARPVYSHVAVWKFALLSFFTLGCYPLVWFYRNWRFVRERDESKILPLLRSILGAVFVFPLARDIGRSAGQLSTAAVVVIGVSYVALNACMRLSPPWDLLSFFSFVPLLFLVRAIDRINRAAGVRGPDYSRMGPSSIAALIVGLPLVLFALVGSVGPGRSEAQAVSSAPSAEARENYLRSARIIEPGEQVLRFSSSASGASETAGSLLSDRRVTTYARYGDRLVVDSARLDDVMLLEVKDASGNSRRTEVLVHTKGANIFRLHLAAADGADRAFLDALKARIGDVEMDPATAQKARAALDEINDVLKSSIHPKAAAAARAESGPAS